MNFQPSFPRYLAAKKSVDDRALNRRVWDALVAALPAQSRTMPVRVLEVGAGIGTMIERLLEHGGLTNAEYTALDASAENIAELDCRLRAWGGVHGWDVASHELRLMRADAQIVVAPVVRDVFDWLAQVDGQTWDVLIAHAFLDLFDVSRALPHMLGVLRPGGVFYLTLNFDGATIFEPTIDATFDLEIERLYHQTMDARVVNGARSGDSRTGRHLFGVLRRAECEILQAGSSDWVVFGSPRGYPTDEAYFMHFIINTVWNALKEDPALTNRRAQFAAWIAERHAQIERGELVYIAHQLDVVGTRGTQ